MRGTGAGVEERLEEARADAAVQIVTVNGYVTVQASRTGYRIDGTVNCEPERVVREHRCRE